MRFGWWIWWLAPSITESETPERAAIPLSVSPDCTVYVLAGAGPAASPAISTPAAAAVNIRVCTLVYLLVRIAITAAQARQGRRAAQVRICHRQRAEQRILLAGQGMRAAERKFKFLPG